MKLSIADVNGAAPSPDERACCWQCNRLKTTCRGTCNDPEKTEDDEEEDEDV